MNDKIAICDDSEADRTYISVLAAQWSASAGRSAGLFRTVPENLRFITRE